MEREGRKLLQAVQRAQAAANAIGLGRRVPKESAAPEVSDSVRLYDALVTSVALRAASRNLYIDGHYVQAVEQAYKCINNLVKEKSGFTSDGQKLMEHVFNEHNPVLAFNRLRSETDKNEQAGYERIFSGCMRGIRNPRAHEHTLRDEPAVALEMLIWANHLLRVLDRSKRRRRRKVQ